MDASFRLRRFTRALKTAGIVDPEIRGLACRIVEILDRIEPVSAQSAERLREDARQDKRTPAAVARMEAVIEVREAERQVAMVEMLKAGELPTLVKEMVASLTSIGPRTVEMLKLVTHEATQAEQWISAWTEEVTGGEGPKDSPP